MTLFSFDERLNPRVPMPEEVSIGSPTDFFANVSAAFRETTFGALPNSRQLALNEARQERREEIERLTGKSFADALTPFGYAPEAEHREIYTQSAPKALLERVLGEEEPIEALRATLPADMQGRILNKAQLVERSHEIARDAAAVNADVYRRSASGFGGIAGQFVGAAGAEFQNPIFLSTLPIGAASGAGLLTAMAVEGAVGFGSDIVAQPITQAFRAEAGLDAGLDVALKTSGTAGVTAAASVPFFRGFGLLFRLAGKVAGVRTKRQLARAFDETVKAPTPDEAAARQQLQDEIDFEEANPLPETPRAHEEHVDRAAAAERALIEDAAPPALDPLPAELAPEPRSHIGEDAPAEAPGEAIYRFRPGDLQVDAERFQFKRGGDALGVNDRFKGVDLFDQRNAGIVFVWEDLAGGRFIADGHQRLGLARRAEAANPDKPVYLQGFLLREADGITAEEARYLAAIKNIADETADVIDVAKVFRARREIPAHLNMRRGVNREAQGLSNLSDDAFTMVVNERVKSAHAAILGRLAHDLPDAHADILAQLAELKPASLVEAESMIRDMLSAPAVRTTQESLFGAEDVTEILFKERARILNATANRLKKDRATFNLLGRERERIEGQGNVLDSAANAERAQLDAILLETIQKLARRTGPIADALAQAAKDLKAGARLDGVVKRFAEDVRGTLEHADGAGRADEPGGRPGDGNADGGTRAQGPEPEQPELELPEGFSGPDYVVEQLRSDLRLARELGIRADVERLAAEEKTAQQTVNELGSRLDRVDELARLNGEPETANSDKQRIVRAVRTALQIPNMDDKTAFAAWLDSYRLREADGDPGTRSLFEEPPAEPVRPSPARIAADDDAVRYAEPGGDAVRAEADQLETEIRETVARDGDFEFADGERIGPDGEPAANVRKASEALDEIAGDEEFLGQMEICLK